MPEIVADADQRRAGQHQPIVVGEAHQQIRHADPEQRDGHQQALAADGIDEQPPGMLEIAPAAAWQVRIEPIWR